MIVAFTSVHGAPGVTTQTLLNAAAWPADLGTDRVVLEADPDGGVLGARYELGVDPGVVSLVSATRRVDGPLAVDEHGRCVAPGLWVVPGPENAEQATAVWSAGAETVAARCAIDEHVWLVDCGRLRGHLANVAFFRHAAQIVVVSGCRREDIVPLPAAVDRLTALSRSGAAGVAAVFVGRLDYRPHEMAEFLGADVLGVVAADDDALTLAASAAAGGRGRRSLLWRSALETAAELAHRSIGHATLAGVELPAGLRPTVTEGRGG